MRLPMPATHFFMLAGCRKVRRVHAMTDGEVA
jgi:hypothetical protein